MILDLINGKIFTNSEWGTRELRGLSIILAPKVLQTYSLIRWLTIFWDSLVDLDFGVKTFS